MANRKELPREKKLKLKVGELKDKILDLEIRNESQESNIKYLNEQLKEREDVIVERANEVSMQVRQIREYEREFKRKQKLIDFLIDSKL